MKLENLTKREKFKLLKLLGLFVGLGISLAKILPIYVNSGQLPIWTPWMYDFAFENSGTLLGLWYSSNSLIPVCVPVESTYAACVPIEVMMVPLFGGVAWALYMPRKCKLTYSIVDILVISTFGAFGEFILIRYSLMHYLQWWTSSHAFISYMGTWIILHFVNYKVLDEP